MSTLGKKPLSAAEKLDRLLKDKTHPFMKLLREEEKKAGSSKPKLERKKGVPLDLGEDKKSSFEDLWSEPPKEREEEQQEEQEIDKEEIAEPPKTFEEAFARLSALEDPLESSSFLEDDEESYDDFSALKFVKHPSESRVEVDYQAERSPCSDFYRYEYLFESVHESLTERRAHIYLLKDINQQKKYNFNEGDFFIHNGQYVLLAETSKLLRRGTKRGERDGRIHLIYENGMESNPLLRSFKRALSQDPTARYIPRSGAGPLDELDREERTHLMGNIYVARSLSTDPILVKNRKNLHKIGVTTQDVKNRVADARNDATFLLADVEIVAIYRLENYNHRLVEEKLHSFFSNVRADIAINDRFGRRYRPTEWFFVAPHHVAEAVKLLEKGELHLYKFNQETHRIEKK